MSRMSSRRCTVRTRRSVRVPRHWYNTRVISQGRADCASLRRRRRSRGLSVRPTAQRPILRTRTVISAFVITASSSSVDRNATTDRTSRSNGGERRQALTSRRGERPFRAEGGRRGCAATCDQRPVINRPGSTPRDGTLAVSDGRSLQARHQRPEVALACMEGLQTRHGRALPKPILLTRPFGQTANSVTEQLELASIIHCVTGRLWTRQASVRMTWP